jgi:16S rRNA (cytidine1402-2'-O)-methyltransferase
MSVKSRSTPSSSTQTESTGRTRRSKPAPNAAPVPAQAPLDAGLYLVATPIGNLGDITLRALDTLRRADVIACEDSRVTGKLLAAHGIATPLTPYHEHNAPRARPKILDRIAAGAAVALVSDAGTPLVSDPGYKLVTAAVARGLPVHALPGPSAALAALTLSGLPSDRFLFLGFLPAKSAARRRALEEVASLRATLIVYESARRLPAALADMAELLGPRPAAVARELTKLHEELRRGPLDALSEDYRAAGPPKGEVVIVVAPPSEDAGDGLSDDALDALLQGAMAGGSLRDAVQEVARATGRPRQEVYARALALARDARE